MLPRQRRRLYGSASTRWARAGEGWVRWRFPARLHLTGWLGGEAKTAAGTGTAVTTDMFSDVSVSVREKTK